MTTSAMRWLPSTRGSLPVAIAIWASIAAIDLSAAQSAPANAPAGGNAAPPDTTAAELAD
jgi:hypothetical protein